MSEEEKVNPVNDYSNPKVRAKDGYKILRLLVKHLDRELRSIIDEMSPYLKTKHKDKKKRNYGMLLHTEPEVLEREKDVINRLTNLLKFLLPSKEKEPPPKNPEKEKDTLTKEDLAHLLNG